MKLVSLRMTLISALVAASFGAGFFTKALFDLAHQAKEARVAVKQSAQNVVASVAQSGRIEQEVAQVTGNVNSIKAAIVKRGVTLHPKQESTHVATAPDHHVLDGSIADIQPAAAGAGAAALVAHGTESACAGSTDFVLDLPTVRLLNAARQGRGLGATGSGDEAQSAPSAIGVADLIANDLDVVQMYLELAKRHDELVDAVEKNLKEQAR